MFRSLFLASLILLPMEAWATARHGYLGIFGGALMVDGLETEKADPLIVTLGHRFNSRVALQLEYSEAKPFRTRITEEGEDDIPCEAEYSSAGAYMVLIQPMGRWIDVNLKLGYIDVDYNFTDSSVANAQKERFNNQSESYGGGVTIKLSRRLVLTTEYTQLQDDAYHLSAGVELSL